MQKTSKTLNTIKEFWLDFFSAYYRRLKKNADYETPYSILLYMGFVQGNCFNSIFVILLHLFSVKLNKWILLAPMVGFVVINCYIFYYKFNESQRKAAIDRKPHYKRIVYDLFDFLSVVLFFIVLYILSKYR